MNLIKKVFKRGNDHGHGTALAKRDGGGPLARKSLFGFDDGLDKLWRGVERDPWSLIRDPWHTLERMTEQLNHLGRWPAVDVSEDDHALTVRCDVPGLEAKDLDIQVSGNLLTISGSRQDEWSDKKKGVRRQERVSGSFSRTIPLPSYVDAEKVDARYEKGTLSVTIPKIAGKGPRRVTVRSA